jgi:hypothetical protein
MAIPIAALVAAFLLAAAFLGHRRLASTPHRGTTGAGAKSCPLCRSVLVAGQTVKSSLFPGGADRIMHIFGCPHCWPATPSVPRICPVCGGALDAGGWVIARYFERPGRRHVHVLGCTGCRG